MIEFRAYGKPEPQGSSRGFVVGNRAVITSANKGLKFWREVVSQEAQRVAPDQLLDGELVLQLDFWLPKPKSVPKKRIRPNVKPDLSKLIRSAEDSCTGVIWVDDARVVELSAAKWYADEFNKPGVRVRVHSIKP